MERPYILADCQLASFREKGYALINDGLSRNEIAVLQTWAQEVHDLPRTPDCQYIPYDEINKFGVQVLCRNENLAGSHAGFGALLRRTKLLGILKKLSGEEMVLLKEKINYKLAGSGGFQPHIDRSGYDKFKTIEHLAICVAIDGSHALNGGIEVIEGSHKMNVPISKDNCIPPKWVEAQTWTHVNMKAGDTLNFGSSLAHRSGPNYSTDDRRAVFATYNGKSEGDLHHAYYEKRAKLWQATHKRKPGVEYSGGAQNYAYGTPMRTINNVQGRL